MNSQQQAAAAMRYRMALGGWWARMFAAGRADKPFDEPRPHIEDFFTEDQP